MEYRANDSIGFLANRLSTAMRRSLEGRLKEYDLTACQFGVLIKLFEEDGQPLSSIGKSVYCDKPTITGIVDRLGKKGLLKKVRDENDRRVIKAVLTEKGRGLRSSLYEVGVTLNSQVLSGFSEDEIEALKIQLKKALDRVLSMMEGGYINV